MMYLLTLEEHAKALDSAESNAEYAEAEYLERREFWGEALDYRWKNLQEASEKAKATLAMLKSMKPVEPVGYLSRCSRFYKTRMMAVENFEQVAEPVYAKEQQ